MLRAIINGIYPDGRTKYLEIRREKQTKINYATLSILIKDDITTEKIIGYLLRFETGCDR